MPPAAQDQSTDQSQVRQVAGSEDGATLLGASADTVPQVEGGAPGAGSAPPGPNPDEEPGEAPQPPFEATCPTCEKPLAVYVPEPAPVASNAYKLDTGFCVGCGRRWTKAELEMAGTLADQATGDRRQATDGGDQGAADGEGAADPSGKKDKDAKDAKETKDAKDGSASGASAGTPAEGASSGPQAPKSSTASSSSSSSAKSP